MSKIRDRVKRKLEAIVTYEEISTIEKVQSILSISELAIVDREAKLPELLTTMGGYISPSDTQQNMLNAGYVKEVKE